MAELHLNSLVTSEKNGILGKYNFSALVSTNQEELKIDEIEKEITQEVKDHALNRYGIEISQINFIKLGLPEVNVEQVLEQMRAERLQYVAQLEAEGERDASFIRNEGERDASFIRNEADVRVAQLKAEGMEEAAKIMGETEAEVAKIYAKAHNESADFYYFLRRLDSLEKILGENSTLIFRMDNAPFDVLNEKNEGDRR